MALRKVDVPGGRHVCEFPRSLDAFEHKTGEVHCCDECGRFWRLLVGSQYHDWQRVGRWESRRFRRLLARGGEQR